MKHLLILAALLASVALTACGGGDATEQEKAEADAAVGRVTIAPPNCAASAASSATGACA